MINNKYGDLTCQKKRIIVEIDSSIYEKLKDYTIKDRTTTNYTRVLLEKIIKDKIIEDKITKTKQLSLPTDDISKNRPTSSEEKEVDVNLITTKPDEPFFLHKEKQAHIPLDRPIIDPFDENQTKGIAPSLIEKMKDNLIKFKEKEIQRKLGISYEH